MQIHDIAAGRDVINQVMFTQQAAKGGVVVAIVTAVCLFLYLHRGWVQALWTALGMQLNVLAEHAPEGFRKMLKLFSEDHQFWKKRPMPMILLVIDLSAGGRHRMLWLPPNVPNSPFSLGCSPRVFSWANPQARPAACHPYFVAEIKQTVRKRKSTRTALKIDWPARASRQAYVACET
jgi:hypothetical protein